MKSQVLKETFFIARGFTRMQRICADFLTTKATKDFTKAHEVSFLSSDQRLMTNDQ
jgi:hypothetical protein